MTDRRTANPAQQPRCLMRMTGLETAVSMIGTQGKLAEAMGIEPRSLRAKLTAERGVADGDLLAAATALDARADHIRDHARKLRGLAA